MTPPHENALGSKPVTASDLKQRFGCYYSAAFARCIDLDQVAWLSADVRLVLPDLPPPRAFVATGGKASGPGLAPGEAAPSRSWRCLAFVQPCSKVKYSATVR